MLGMGILTQDVLTTPAGQERHGAQENIRERKNPSLALKEGTDQVISLAGQLVSINCAWGQWHKNYGWTQI